jgi:CubicO group peptidase (beta-lactamase class C family)
MNRFSLPSLLSLSFAAAVSIASTAACADEFDGARTRIRNVIASHNIPSVTVAVAHKEKIIWEESFGWADIEKRIPATPHTAYSLASISKSITATAMMVLVERGTIELDKPIEDYLGKQKLTARIGNASDATVRRVASHTAGLPPHARFFYKDERGGAPPFGETVQRYGTLVSPPGESFVYSNLGFGLLENAIERTSGKRYEQFLQDELFVPLGLQETSTDRVPNSQIQVATGYWGDHAVPAFTSDDQGSGSVFMSAHDLARSGMFHLHGRVEGQTKPVLKSSTLVSMRDMTALNDGSPAGYGVGWFVGERHGLPYFGHNGGRAGAATVLSIYPDAQAVIVVLANGVSRIGAVHSLENDIVHALLPETIRKDHGFKPAAELVGRWRGHVHTYSGQVPMALEFNRNGSIFARVASDQVQEVVKVKSDPKTGSLKLDDLLGEVGTSDAARHPGPLQISLKMLSPNTLGGSITSNSLETLSDRMGSAVSYWIELHRNDTTHD